jgi:ABC-2 type transport system permease protein
VPNQAHVITAMAATVQTVERTSESPHLRVGERLRVLAAHREILANLVRKELKVKYAAALQSAVLLLYIIVSGYGLHLPELALWPLAFVTLVVLTVALSLWFSALNVRYRDVGHLLNIALLVWFWATPIVYAEFQVQQLAAKGEGTWLGIPRLALYLLNPMVDVVAGFHRAMYGVVTPIVGQDPVLFDKSLGWVAGVLTITLVVSLVGLRLAWGYFFSRSGDFAEEL